MTWISVKERLPRKLQKVLFHWVMQGNLRNISMGYLCDKVWYIYLPYHSFGLRADAWLVTHWMECPEFPFCSETELNDINEKCQKIHFIEWGADGRKEED